MIMHVCSEPDISHLTHSHAPAADPEPGAGIFITGLIEFVFQTVDKVFLVDALAEEGSSWIRSWKWWPWFWASSAG